MKRSATLKCSKSKTRWSLVASTKTDAQKIDEGCREFRMETHAHKCWFHSHRHSRWWPMKDIEQLVRVLDCQPQVTLNGDDCGCVRLLNSG